MNLLLANILRYGFTPDTNNSLTLASLSRPAAVLNEFYNAFGDSTTFGVSAPAGQDWPSQFRGIVTGPTAAFNGGTGGNNGASIVEIGNGGVGGENSASVTARVTGLSPSFTAQLGRHMFYMAGLNDYNTGVPGWTRVWPEQVQANYATAAAAVTGGKKMVAVTAIPENNEAAGSRIAADHRFHFLDKVERYNELAFDMGRYLRFVRQLEGPVGTADADALAVGHVPYTYRGNTDSTAFATNDAAVLTGTTNPTDLNFAEGRLYWQSTSSVMFRKAGASGTGSWKTVDGKHMSAQGNAVIARVMADIAMALEGNGPPVVRPARLRVAANAAQGATVGEVEAIGTATRYALRTYADGPVTDYAISSTGVITKAIAGSLTQGVTELVVVAENENGALLSPVDIYVARPSTVTAPVLRPISAGIVAAARRSDILSDGKAFSAAFYFNTSSLAATQQMMVLLRSGTGSTTPIQIQLTTAGGTRIIVTDSTGTLVGNLNLSTAVATINNPFWMLIGLDFATNTRSVYLTESPQTVGSITNGANIQMADATPIFWAANEVNQYRALSSPFAGQVGGMWFWDGYIDWSNATNRRALFAADGTPASRTPYAAVGGLVPKFELWGGKGDWLWGTPDGSYSKKTLSTSRRAQTVMS
jgi:lysophospholipase L1-like esterase